MKLRLMDRVPERPSARRAGFASLGCCVCGPGCCVCGTGLILPLGSAAFAFGMMENLSSKLCAAAGFTCIPTHAETAAIAILEKRRMIPHEQKNKPNKLRDILKVVPPTGGRFGSAATGALALALHNQAVVSDFVEAGTLVLRCA